MRIYHTKNYDEMSRKAADILAAQIVLKPDSVLGLATGSTPVGAYGQLIEGYKKGQLDFSEITTVNLDEYKGLAPDNDQSYRYFMNTNLFDHVNVRPECTHVPDGLTKDEDAECARYEALIKSLGGIDLQLLGLGGNGHIGFNEPDDCFEKLTHCVTLTQSTIDANKRFFEREEDVPRQAYTMGIGAIMNAEAVLVIVSGKQKAKIVKEAFTGPVTPKVPASVLQLHRNLIIVGDAEALSEL